MPSADILLPFFIATAVFACVCGSGMLYAAAQTVALGRRAGWMSMLGFHLAGYVHISAAAFGLAVLLEMVPVLYAFVKLAGAAYLVWLGVRLIAGSSSNAAAAVRTRSQLHAVRDSFVVEVLNPKTALFYLAFLPQFTDASAQLPIWAQVLVLGLTVNAVFSVTDAVCVLLSDRATRFLSASPGANRLARWVGGGVLVAMGVSLAMPGSD